MKKTLLFVLVLCLTASVAAASPYVSGNLGMSIIGESDVEATISGTTWDVGSFEYDNGIALTGAIGTEFGKNKRVEFEIGYRSNDVESVNVLGTSFDGADSKISDLTFMVNGFYDFKSEGSKIAPFLGLGAGYVSIKAEGDGVTDNYAGIGLQFIAGLGLKVAENLNLDLQYRVLVTGGFEENIGGGDKLSAEYVPHSVLVGLRHSF